MEQKSNVQYRAEKEYKNSREKFFLLLREIISNAIHAVLIRESKEKNYIPELNLDVVFDEKMNDPKVYKLWQEGKTIGVFQFESQGMTNFMKELKPDSLEDIIAGVSLYRPGPMDQIPRYIKNKLKEHNLCSFNFYLNCSFFKVSVVHLTSLSST